MELTSRFGKHLALPIEYGGEWTNERYLERFRTALIDSIDRKRRIALDLLERQRWDLFLTVFSEPPHPLYSARAQPGKNALFVHFLFVHFCIKQKNLLIHDVNIK